MGPLLLAAIAVGCTSSGDAAPATTVADPSNTTVAPATDPTAADPTEVDPTATTETVVVKSFATPTDAGKELFAVWRSGDGAAAAGLAQPVEILKLFAVPALPEAKNRGCDDGAFGAANCFFGNGQGGVNVSLVPGPNGWQIDTIEAY